MKDFSIDQAAVAYLLGVTTRTVRTWQDDGSNPLPVLQRGKRGTQHRYDPQAVCRWWRDREIARLIDDGDTGERLDLEQERALLARAQRHRVELEVEQLRANLIPRDLSVATWQALVASARAKLLSMPTKVAHAVVAATELAEAEGIVRSHVYEALNELASDGLPDSIRKRLQEDGNGVEAAAEPDGESVGGPVSQAKPGKRRRTRPVAH